MFPVCVECHANLLLSNPAGSGLRFSFAFAHQELSFWLIYQNSLSDFPMMSAVGYSKSPLTRWSGRPLAAYSATSSSAARRTLPLVFDLACLTAPAVSLDGMEPAASSATVFTLPSVSDTLPSVMELIWLAFASCRRSSRSSACTRS